MSLKHIVFIVNPKSGMERQKEIQNGIDANLDQSKYSYELKHTEYAKHGTVLAREAAQNGAYAVVAVGGDGSVNDVVKGLLGTDTVLGIIPKGSGNGMARNLGIPLDTAGAIKVISSGHPQKIDIGFANGEVFTSNAGVGFDALIAHKFATSERRGFLIYSWLVTKYMWLYKSFHWQITVDGKTFAKRAFMAVVANGQQFGYNFRIAAMADHTDGLLDLVIIRRFPKILGGLIALRAMKGTLAASPYVEHFKGKEIVITHPLLKRIQTDGDAHPSPDKITFTIQPAALKVIVP